MLLTHAQLVEFDGQHGATTRLADIRIDASHISAIGHLEAAPDETIINADGNALLPGLHDHHVHFLSYAASLGSVACGPPAVTSPDELQAALANAPGSGWLRGYGYHESVAGEIDRHWLDRHGPERPVRIQHRSGRLWIVNSPGLAAIRSGASDSPGGQQRNAVDQQNGRLFDVDELLRDLLPTDFSSVRDASQRLAAFGVTAFNDMTPSNSAKTFALYREFIAAGDLLQSVRLSGLPELSRIAGDASVAPGATKVHLHEAALPDFDALCQLIAESHSNCRNVAIHCVTETELVFALAAMRDAGARPDDRIEHASVTPPALIEQIRELQVTVVTQPGFVLERGDAYLADIRSSEHAWLYRAATLLWNGIPLAFATDMPFGGANPWLAMQAATNRQTATGNILGAAERVTPTFAVAAFLGSINKPAQPQNITVGGVADLCLLDRPWQTALENLSAVGVRATISRGNLIHRVNSLGARDEQRSK